MIHPFVRRAPGSAEATLSSMSDALITELAETLMLGGLLELLRERVGGYELLAHWEQGEFHHDVVLALPEGAATFGYLVVATNCNGGVKEVLAFTTPPDRDTLWHWRCPRAPDFAPASTLALCGRAVTTHWFDPCELLAPDARSELRIEHRRRQRGGGWKKVGCE